MIIHHLITCTQLTRKKKMFSSYKVRHFENNLQKAAVSNNLELVKAILQQGADKYSEDTTGCIAFTHALMSKKEINPEILKLLQPDNDYWTSTDRSQRRGMKLRQILRSPRWVLELFLNYCNVNWKAVDFDESTPLHILVTNKHHDVFDLFLTMEFDVDARNSDGDTALHCAARRNSKDAIEFLLNKGANVNITNSEGMTPLLCSVQSFIRYDFREAASMRLLENGANPQVLDSYARDYGFSNNNLLEAVIAHVAIDEMHRTPIKDTIWKEKYNDYYENCMQQLNLMKQDVMFGTVTVFQFLTEDESKIATYARSQDAVEWFEWFENSVEGYNSYYDRLLKKRFCKARKMNEWKNEAAFFISQAIHIFDSDHIAMEKIVNYLECRDLVKYS